jgi:hypothetical protein
MPAGRPTLYSPELLEQAERYLQNWQAEGDQMPSVAGLSVYLNIRRSTCYAWAKEADKEEFSDILAAIMDKQEQVLFNKGLVGDFNSTIAKLALTKHDYSDKSENTIQGGENPLTIQAPWQVVGVKGS